MQKLGNNLARRNVFPQFLARQLLNALTESRAADVVSPPIAARPEPRSRGRALQSTRAPARLGTIDTKLGRT
jgi:hypothetical protein